jgi:hypothetical protein
MLRSESVVYAEYTHLGHFSKCNGKRAIVVNGPDHPAASMEVQQHSIFSCARNDLPFAGNSIGVYFHDLHVRGQRVLLHPHGCHLLEHIS